MNRHRLEQILGQMSTRRIAVVGDFCLDAYWTLDTRARERSIETGRPVRKVVAQRYSLGGAGNVAANLAALRVRQVIALGVVGDDPFGREMLRLLSPLGVVADGMLVQQDAWDTPTYCKPHLDDVEQDRIDFGGRNALAESTADALLAALRGVWGRIDALIVNQQLTRGVWTERTTGGLRELAGVWTGGPVVVVDSRDRTPALPGPAILKLNRTEAARMLGEAVPPARPIPLDRTRRHAERIHQRTGRPVLITLGASGNLVATEGGVEVIAGVSIDGPVDPVGAGDATLAAFTAALACGASPVEAAELANLASAVTVRKLHQTGTASPDEILDLAGQIGGR